MADYISSLTGPQMDAALMDMALHQSEAYAVGSRNGIDVTSGDATYHNNSKWYSQQASSAVTAANNYATQASNSANSASTYANNASSSATAASNSASAASTSATNASTNALKAEGYAVGKQNGSNVGSTSPYYHNNASYWATEAASSASAAATSAANIGNLNGIFAINPADGHLYYGDISWMNATFALNTDGHLIVTLA